MPTRGQGSPFMSLQSSAQVEQVSPGSQVPLPQQVAPLQQGPQSALHVWQLSPTPQVPSPHAAPAPVELPPAPPCPPPPVLEELLSAAVPVVPLLAQPESAAPASGVRRSQMAP